MAGKGKGPAKTKSKKARKAAAAKAAKTAQAAADSSLARPDGATQSPQAAGMAAATAAAADFGFAGSKPDTLSRHEAAAVAEAVASAAGERLGIKVSQKGKLSRREAKQAAEIALAIKVDRAGKADTPTNPRELAESRAEKKVESFENNPDAAVNMAGLAQKIKEDMAAIPKPDPGFSRLEAVAAMTNAIMDRLGYPPNPNLSRREAQGEAAAGTRRKRAETAPALSRQAADQEIPTNTRRIRSITASPIIRPDADQETKGNIRRNRSDTVPAASRREAFENLETARRKRADTF